MDKYDEDYRILQIIPATDGWWSLYDPRDESYFVKYDLPETDIPDEECDVEPVACWAMVERTDESGDVIRWVDGIGDEFLSSADAIKRKEMFNHSLCSDNEGFRKFIYDPARTRALRSHKILRVGQGI